MKRWFTIMAMCLAGGVAMGQQAPQYSLYMLNRFAFNPAYAGLDQNALSVTGLYRQQWVGLEGAPQTQYVGVHMPLYIAGGGIGLQLQNEQMGIQQQLSISAAYNYQTPVGNWGILSIGVGAGVFQTSLDGSAILTPEGNYEGLINHNDLILPEGRISGSTYFANVGVYLQAERLEIGIASLNVTENLLNLESIDFQLARSYNAFVSYTIDIGRALRLSPSALFKTDLEQSQLDFSLLASYNDNIFAGASFRGYNSDTNDAVVIIAGLRLNEKWTLAYGYDLTLSSLNSVSNGSHEIMVNFNLGKTFGEGRLPPIIYNPRL
jgi:type IX secretion system PorP/SprF family membrane protein